MKGWKKIFHANGNKKRDGLLTLILEKVFFKIKSITKGKERHYKMINTRRGYNIS